MNPLARFSITRKSEDDVGKFHDARYDDTVDLALTEEDILALTLAAEEAHPEAAEEHPEASRDKSPLIAKAADPTDENMRSGKWLRLLAASVSAIVIGTVLGAVWSVVADRSSPTTFRVSSAAARPASSADSRVRFSNPFDASEVFQFPPGTSDEQARRSVAAILAQRARDRQEAGVATADPPAPGDVDRTDVARNSEQRDLPQ